MPQPRTSPTRPARPHRRPRPSHVLLVGATLAAVAAGALTAPAAGATAGAVPVPPRAVAGTVSADPGTAILAAPHRSAAVCGAPAPGRVGCLADVVTDGALAPLATRGWTSGFSPAQLRTVYGLGGLSSTALVAVVDAYAHPRPAADLNAYRTQFGLGRARYRQLAQDGSTTMPAADAAWGQEQMLDLEMVSAICPTCRLLYVAARSTGFADLAAATATAVARGAKVVSDSYGAPEFAGQGAYAASYTHSGVAFTASTGDAGYGTQVPAAYNTVTAVGGTRLTLAADGSRATETAWSGGGSGCSTSVAKPAWQHDTGCAGRTVADLAAVADPDTGVAVYDSYGSSGGRTWYVFGGTSVAAPIIAGAYALAGRPPKVAAALAYAAPAGALYDVRSGSNGTCTPAYLCRAGAGFDGPTGLGTPNGVGAL